ncbi:MAG TPA: CbiX/SirB N-terminal domain-containing protein [Burkholderiaceae bacterium]|nr:CbiX/SirB N-terminal domain-containing protein [Burkholderiaceae bacterium]
MVQRSLILFAHGARDPRWAAPFERLRQITQVRLPEVTVSLAFLEFMQPSLPGLIRQLVADGDHDATVVPVFLGQGGHVLRDLPAMVEQLRKDYPGLSLKVADAVGENAEVLNAIAQYCAGSLSHE